MGMVKVCMLAGREDGHAKPRTPSVRAAPVLIRQAAEMLPGGRRMGKSNPGRYSDNFASGASTYPSTSMYDDLAWGAAWLFRATNDTTYLTVYPTWCLSALYLLPPPRVSRSAQKCAHLPLTVLCVGGAGVADVSAGDHRPGVVHALAAVQLGQFVPRRRAAALAAGPLRIQPRRRGARRMNTALLHDDKGVLDLAPMFGHLNLHKMNECFVTQPLARTIQMQQRQCSIVA